MMIALGLGLHNFAEGLAIRNSAAAGQISLAVLLIIGFACTTPPRASESSLPSTGASGRPGGGWPSSA